MKEQEFIQRCLNHDKAAWDEFVDRYSRLIYNYIYCVHKFKGIAFSPDTVEDIFQEIFLKLIKDNCHKLRQFKGKNNASLASWLRIITINFCLDYIRKDKGSQLASLDDDCSEDGASLGDILVDQRNLADEALINQERLDYLAECFDTLNMQDKYIVEMHIYQGLDIRDLQATLGVSRSAVDMRKNRIIHKLRDCFREKGVQVDF